MNQFATLFEKPRSITLRQRKEIKHVLEDGARTVSMLAKMTGIPKEQVIWNIMAMLRWAEVEVSGHKEEELCYSLKEGGH